MSDLLRVLAVLALVAANAFLVIGEYSVVTARRARLAARAEGGSRGAQAALRLMDDPVRVISTVQVGITAIGILTGAVAQPLVLDLLGDDLPNWLAFLIAFAIVTYLSVVFGELVPKALTLDRAERLVAAVAIPIEVMTKVLRPIVWVLEISAEWALRPFGVHEVVAGESVRNAQELRAIVDEAESAGVIPRAQEEMLHNVFDFAHQEAADVMVPAPDVVWLDAGLTPEQAMDRAADQPYSRYPVGDGSLDRVAGVIHVRDLVSAGRREPAVPIRAFVNQTFVVPETKDLGALLRELREARQHLAIVVDEYGGTAGIVTLEDILEELVGEIEDEYDLPDDTLERVDERTVRVAGTMTIDDFNETLGTDLDDGAARTLAGLVFNELGRRPREGDEVSAGDVRLRVEQLDGNRITRLLVQLPADSGAPRAS
jgi:magnesium and cobalt exporter, CNNM family